MSNTIKIGQKASANKYNVHCPCGVTINHDVADILDDFEQIMHRDSVDENVTCEECGTVLNVEIVYEIEVDIDHVTAKVVHLPAKVDKELRREELYIGLPVNLENGAYPIHGGSVYIEDGVIQNIFSEADEKQLTLELEESK